MYVSRRTSLRFLSSLAVCSGLFSRCGHLVGDDSAKSESDLWELQKTRASTALDFWEKFLALRQGTNNTLDLTPEYRGNWLCLIRAVSWVESKHGTSGSQQPARDPMQCGNPNDAWWKSVTKQLPDFGMDGDASNDKYDRIIGGPNVSNYWSFELPAAAAMATTFPEAAKLSTLGDIKLGHKDEKFNPDMSYFWGIPYLIHRVNVKADGKTFKCGVYSKNRMIEGATTYNGGGDPSYKTKLLNAVQGETGCSLP